MILIADCGATKADWILLEKGKDDRHEHTLGFNPVVHKPELLQGEVTKLSQDLWTNISPTSVYYYGAGCWDFRRKTLVADALSSAWPDAELKVMHDLLGAARATCGYDAGIACILGTGSNTCLYDGQDVIDNVTNLGYLLGDEGSGSHIGKAFLRAYFYRELDEELMQAFEEYNAIDRQSVLDTIYESSVPNTYLASFTRFMGEYKEHPLIQKIIFASFGEFLDRHVRKYKGHLDVPVHFIGSVAFHFKTILLAALHERGMHAGNFIPKPIDALADFHRADL